MTGVNSVSLFITPNKQAESSELVSEEPLITDQIRFTDRSMLKHPMGGTKCVSSFIHINQFFPISGFFRIDSVYLDQRSGKLRTVGGTSNSSNERLGLDYLLFWFRSGMFKLLTYGCSISLSLSDTSIAFSF